MSTVVGTLQVDLVANTATFSYDLDQGGKAARQFGADASEGFGSAREGAMLLEEATGVRLPRALTGLLSRIPALGSAFSAMLPVTGVVAAIGIIAELMAKHAEAVEKMREAQENFGTTTSHVFASLEDKLLEAGIKADELAHDHLGALAKELQRIDHTSFEELEKQFDVLAKAGEAVFAQLKSHWYTFGEGSTGAQNALKQFQAQYSELLEKGDSKGATDKLTGTLIIAQTILKQLQLDAKTAFADWGVKDKLAAQEKLVQVLEDQLKVEQTQAALDAAKKGNVKTEAGNAMNEDADKAFKQQAEQARQAAEAEEKAFEEKYKEAVSALQESEKAKVDAARVGSAARLAAIDAAIKEEQSKGLQDTAYYKELQLAKVNAVKDRAQMQEKIEADIAKASMDNTARVAALKATIEGQSDKAALAMRKITADKALADDVDSENRRYAATQEASAKYLAFLQQDGEKNAEAIRQVHAKIEQETQEHENKLTQIRTSAEEQRNKSILSSETQLEQAISRNMAQTLVTGKSLAQSMEKLGAQMLEGVISNTLMMIMTDDQAKLSKAKVAAASAYASVSEIPIVGPYLAPEAAAGAFAAVMAFDGGGIVPGINGGRDSVNAVLGPEEMVLPAPLSTGLQQMIKDGVAGNKNAGDTHLHYSNTDHVNTIDGDGMREALEAHSDMVQGHIQGVLRKRNK